MLQSPLRVSIYPIFLSFMLTACQGETTVPTISDSLPTKGKTKWSTNAARQPIIQGGDGREQGLWNDPSVLKEGNTYVMYKTSSVSQPFKPPVLPFRATSQDGINWVLSPKQPLLKAKNTEFISIETPSVIKFRETYHMYYTGIYPEGTVPSMAIGHATSQDGIHWEHHQVLLRATGQVRDWNGYLVAEPGAVVFREKVYLYFTAMGEREGGQPPQLQTIGLITSDDGYHFSDQKPVLNQSELYPPEAGYVGYSTPAAFVLKNRMHLVYDVAAFYATENPQWQQVALHHAYSENGESNFIEDKQPMLTRSDFNWTSGEILAPSAIVDGGKIKLWFAGHVNYAGLKSFIKNGFRGREFGIGYTEISISSLMNEHSP